LKNMKQSARGDKAPHIVVVGSLNMDLVVEVNAIPAPGETVLGSNFATFPGGKGANQAVAAARLGAHVSLIGRVGADAFGEDVVQKARGEGVDVTHVGVDPEAATGVAMITVAASGENSIAVASGANYTLKPEQVERAWAQLGEIDALVMPLENPLETVVAASRLAAAAGVPVILNPAPARTLPDELLARVAVLVPNETEAAQLSGQPVTDKGEAVAAAQTLLAAGVGQVVLTRGARGALLLESPTGPPLQIDPHPVDVVDTTGAGDTFVAALAVALSEGQSPAEAVRFANAAGALAVTRAGAQSSLPTRRMVETLLA
jgi:ribokinase